MYMYMYVLSFDSPFKASLSRISIKRNRLEHVPKALRHLPRLEDLDISNNEITVISTGKKEPTFSSQCFVHFLPRTSFKTLYQRVRLAVIVGKQQKV